MISLLIILLQIPPNTNTFFTRKAHAQANRILEGNVVLGNKMKDEVYGTACPVSLNRAYTVSHVIAHGITHAIIVGDNSTEQFKIRVVFNSKEKDIALIELVSEEDGELATFPTFYRRANNPPLPGAPIIALFTIPPFTQVPSFGTVYGKIPDKDGFYISSLVSNGSSGSCVLNESGEVVGISQGIFTWGYDAPGAPVFQATRIGLVTRDVKLP